jgi:hypothetical protein
VSCNYTANLLIPNDILAKICYFFCFIARLLRAIYMCETLVYKYVDLSRLSTIEMSSKQREILINLKNPPPLVVVMY